jgi:hypothetical protein
MVKAFQAADQPVISVDPKKQELEEEFKNSGRELRSKAAPESGRVHDFEIPQLSRVAPYRVYDRTQHMGKRSARRKNSHIPSCLVVKS